MAPAEAEDRTVWSSPEHALLITGRAFLRCSTPYSSRWSAGRRVVDECRANLRERIDADVQRRDLRELFLTSFWKSAAFLFQARRRLKLRDALQYAVTCATTPRSFTASDCACLRTWRAPLPAYEPARKTLRDAGRRRGLPRSSLPRSFPKFVPTANCNRRLAGKRARLRRSVLISLTNGVESTDFPRATPSPRWRANQRAHRSSGANRRELLLGAVSARGECPPRHSGRGFRNFMKAPYRSEWVRNCRTPPPLRIAVPSRIIWYLTLSGTDLWHRPKAATPDPPEPGNFPAVTPLTSPFWPMAAMKRAPPLRVTHFHSPFMLGQQHQRLPSSRPRLSGRRRRSVGTL